MITVVLPQGEKFYSSYDPNSLLYISKVSLPVSIQLWTRLTQPYLLLAARGANLTALSLPHTPLFLSFVKAMDLFDMGDGFPSLMEGVGRVKCPILVRNECPSPHPQAMQSGMKSRLSCDDHDLLVLCCRCWV